jgi:hypothetical protein
MSQQMKTITTPDGRKIQSKVFAVGQRVMHNSPAIVVEPDATGHYEGHVTLKGERDGIVFVAWANHCDSAEPERRMSTLAEDLFEFARLFRECPGALTEHMLKATALNLIAPGVESALGGL